MNILNTSVSDTTQTASPPVTTTTTMSDDARLPPPPPPATATTTTTTTTTNAPTLSVPSVPYPTPIRTTLSIPPMQPRFKPEDLPPDTKPEDVARLTECHVLERVPPTEKKKYPSKRCKVCLRRSGYTPSPARKHPKESVYHCPQCPSKPGLCCYPCYYVYHSKLDYWEPDEREAYLAGGGGGGVGAGEFPGAGYAGGDGNDGGPSSTFGGGLGGAYGEYGFGDAGSGGFPLPGGAGRGGIGDHLQAGQQQQPPYQGDIIDLDAEQREHKFCPVPMYGESVYGPGGL